MRIYEYLCCHTPSTNVFIYTVFIHIFYTLINSGGPQTSSTNHLFIHLIILPLLDAPSAPIMKDKMEGDGILYVCVRKMLFVDFYKDAQVNKSKKWYVMVNTASYACCTDNRTDADGFLFFPICVLFLSPFCVAVVSSGLDFHFCNHNCQPLQLVLLFEKEFKYYYNITIIEFEVWIFNWER